jgi:hypothetical protein
MLRKSDCAANLDPSPRLVSWWPARMLPPAVTARRAYIQSGLELDEDCGSDVFLLLSRHEDMSRDWGGGGRSRALWRQLALLRDPYTTPTYSMRYLRDLPQVCQATQLRVFVQPFQISKNTAPHTEKARMTFQTDLHNARDLVQIPHPSEALFRLRSRHSQLLCNQNKQWHKRQLTG